MKIKELLESKNVQFVNRSSGMMTCGTVSLNCLEQAEKELRAIVLNDVLDRLYDVVDRLDDEERSGACDAKEEVLKMIAENN